MVFHTTGVFNRMNATDSLEPRSSREFYADENYQRGFFLR